MAASIPVAARNWLPSRAPTLVCRDFAYNSHLITMYLVSTYFSRT
jgi:hypothetical protein